MKTPILIIVGLFVLFPGPQLARACTCDVAILSLDLLKHHTVFAGKVKHIKQLEDGTQDRIVFFDVTDPWKRWNEGRAGEKESRLWLIKMSIEESLPW